MNARWKAWIAFLIVFALGGVTGASINGIYKSRNPEITPATPVSIRDTDAYFATLTRELTLNGEQSTEMRAILDRTRDDYKAVCADVRPRYDMVRERAREQMRALLTAEQKPLFDSIVTAEDCRCPEVKK